MCWGNSCSSTLAMTRLLVHVQYAHLAPDLYFLGALKLHQMLNWHSAAFQNREVKMAPLLHVFAYSTAENMALIWGYFLIPFFLIHLLPPAQGIPLTITTLCFQSFKEMITHHLKNSLCGRVSKLSCALGGDEDVPVCSAIVGRCRKPASCPLKRGRGKRQYPGYTFCCVLGLKPRWRVDKISMYMDSERTPLTGTVEGNSKSDGIVHLCPPQLLKLAPQQRCHALLSPLTACPAHLCHPHPNISNTCNGICKFLGSF